MYTSEFPFLQMTTTLLEKNDETYWVPETIREGRFANWLRDARDWNLSRCRFLNV
jgi:isoleucyl-tRNA synthetase